MIFYEALNKAALKLDAERQMSNLIQHNPSRGAFREFVLSSIVRPFLPKRYGLSNGQCFDSVEGMSKQLDIIVYDDLFSYTIPFGDSQLMPIESAYGEIEVKSMLNKSSFMQGIENISSFKRLQREPAGNCQILPNIEIDITGITWDRVGFRKPFGVLFAYDSVEPKTALKYFHGIKPLNPDLMPDMIVLFKKETIIFRIKYEGEKLYPTTGNTYGGFMPVPCGEDTLPIFLSFLMNRINDTRIKLTNTSDMFNDQVDKHIRMIGEQPVVKFSEEFSGKN